AILASSLFLLMMGIMTVQKMSLVTSLRMLLHPDVTIEQGYSIIAILLVAPYLFSLFLMAWNIPILRKPKDFSMPSTVNIITGVCAAVVEAFCVVVFTTRVMAVLPVFVSLPATHGVLAVSAATEAVSRSCKSSAKLTVSDQSSNRTKASHKSFLCGGARILASILCILSSPIVASILYFLNQADLVTSLTLTLVPSVLAAHFFAGLFNCAFSYVSFALCQPLFGVVIPSLLSMMTSIVLCVILGPSMYGIEETTYFGPFSIFVACSFVFAWAWAWPYILNATSMAQKPKFLLMPHKILFRGYGWNPIFYDQKMFLRLDTKQLHRVSSYERKVKNRIYVCTTMYREADYEMERLLMSLIQVCSDPALEGIHLESNVFMDNGCKGETLNEFALQFVAVLVSKANVMLDKARCWLTPYGMQIFCKLPCGLPLFVHFKDPQKVKAKKRWSQSMYINYVMRFRKVLWQNDCDNTSSLETDICKIIPTLSTIVQGTEENQMTFVGNNEQFMLRRISNIGYPTLVDFRVGPESDQGGTSVEDSSPPNSDSGSQGFASSSSKESSDLESLPEDTTRELPPNSYMNIGFKSDEYVCRTESSAKDNGAGRCYIYRLNMVALDNASFITDKSNASDSMDSYNDLAFDDAALVDDDHTFILATDADMDFKGKAVRELLDLCNGDKMIGAACGRTHPVGKKCSSIVWHQVFEYAKGKLLWVFCVRKTKLLELIQKYFWMIKNAQNVIGSVSCCPGCFSLYRASAIRDVMNKYSSPTKTPFTVYVKDTGEDRWMATLMMINGWRMRYSPFADNSTYCPDSFEEYYKQRRRWILSDMANAILVVQNLFRLVRNNDCFSFVYIVYLVNMFLNNVITPGTAIVMITAEINAGHFHFQQHYVIMLLTLSLVYAALMHPRESYQIIYGFAYLFIFPAMHVLLPIYSIANIVDQSWGTRDSTNAKLPKISCIPAFRKMRKSLRKSKPRNDEKDSSANPTGDAKCELQDIISSLLVDMSKGDLQAREEHKFWESLTSTRLGTEVNKGLGKAELAEGLRVLRNRLFAGFLILNALWLGFLSYFYLGLDTPLSRLNIYGMISGALYGFTLIIQIVGLTVSRVDQVLTRLAKYVYKDDVPLWVHEKDASS
ncbi:unnamed protein product, partial [Candidula unifasciata]